jgi:O-phosphoseryl-tRNA(Cys) synthetase
MNTEKVIEKVLETYMDSQINLASKASREQLAAQITAAVEVKSATDTRILDEVYTRLTRMLEATDGNGTGRALKSYIEEEWQTSDYLARFQEVGLGRQGEIGVSDRHTDGCGYDDGEHENNPF